MSQYGVAVGIYDTGCGCGICIYKECICIGGIIRALYITVTQGVLDCGEGRHGFAVALQL